MEREDRQLNMMEFVKKSVAFGVGAAAFSAEKLKQFADDMVARGEMTSEEASNFVDDMTRRADEEKKSLQDWMREQISKMLAQAGAAEVGRVEALETRVAALERRMAELTMERQPTLRPEDEGGAAEIPPPPPEPTA